MIISYNTRHMLRPCIQAALLEASKHVMVVDNASTDGSQEMLRNEFPSVQLICSPQNLGFGAAANLGMTSCQSEYVFLINSDVILNPGSLKTLCTYLQEHRLAAVVGPRLLSPDGRLLPSCYPFPTPLDIFLDVTHIGQVFRYIPGLRQRYLRTWDHAQDRCVPWVSGAAWMIRREAFDQVGGFDPSFFMYYEEVDVCFRLVQAGWQIHYSPAAQAVHVGGAATQRYLEEMTIQFFASLAHFYRLHYSRFRFLMLTLLIETIALGRLLRDRLRGQLATDPQKRERFAAYVRVWARIWSGEWKRQVAHR